MAKNYGLKLDPPNQRDWKFGFSPLPMEIINESGDWSGYLPYKEIQNFNSVETSACVTFTILHCVEILIKAQYGLDRNYSERFLATISGTKDGGNAPGTVCEFLRKIGVVAQEVWPFDESVKSFNDFYAPISPKLYELAREFNSEWNFKHETVPNNNLAIQSALQCSPLGISVTAWKRGSDGKYVQVKGYDDNHFTTLIAIKDGEYKRVFDSYADGEGDPFLKDYEWNSTHAIIKRFYVKKKENQGEPRSFLEFLKSLFA